MSSSRSCATESVHATPALLKEVIVSGILPPQATVRTEMVTTVDGIAALRPCYDHLQRVTGNPLPFALHEWHLAWCHHFLNHNPRIREEPLFYVLRDPAGTCVAIVPLIVSRRRVGPLKIVTVNMLGADPAITEIRTPLVAPAYEALAACAVQRHLANSGHWDWIHWCGMNEAFAQALAAGGRMQWQPAQSDFVLDMAPTWDEFRRRLKRNIRESLRHCYNSLRRDSHGFELQVIEDPLELQRGLERFLELHRMRANLNTAALHPNRFASKVSRDFLYEVCDAPLQAPRSAPVSAQNRLEDRRHAYRLRGGRQSLSVLLGLRPGMVSLQRHDDDRGRGHQVCDCARDSRPSIYRPAGTSPRHAGTRGRSTINPPTSREGACVRAWRIKPT